jgi:nucleotide-binding universal stress UspA family protein
MKKEIKILVPLDFSDCSENALVYAIQLANKIKANLLVLNIPSLDSRNFTNSLSASLEFKEQVGQSRERMRKSIQKATESVSAGLDKILSIKTNFEIGNVEATICDIATRNQVDYIVMGTQGENNALDKYLGSVASNVLKNSSCPVIVIPQNAAFEKKLIIGYAIDFWYVHPYEIWRAIKLFNNFQSEIKCVHFSQKPEGSKNKIIDLESYFIETAPELNIEFHSLPLKNKLKDMNRFIENENVNMLVMYKPKRTFFESLFHKSYTEKMARNSNIPLLVLPEV